MDAQKRRSKETIKHYRTSFGRHLSLLRQQRLYSRAELAKLLELEPSYINHLEAGRRLPDIINLIKLCQILNADPGQFPLPAKNT